MKKKTWRIILLSLLTLIVIGLIILPGIARNYLVKNSKELVGRQIELERLKVNYFTASLRLQNFKLYEANEKDIFVRFDTLIVNLEPWQLFRGDLNVEQLYLSGLSAKVIQDDTLFNFSDLIEYHTPKDSTIAEPQDTTSSELFTFQLENTKIFNGEIIYEDAEVNEYIALRGIDLFIPYFGWDNEIDRTSGLKFNFENGGFLQLNADWDPESNNLEGLITIDSLDLQNFAGYSRKFVNLGMLEGTVDAKINVQRPMEDLNSLKLFGSVDVNQFVAAAEDGDTIVGFNHLRLSLADIKPLQQKFVVDSVILHKPQVQFDKYDSVRTNFSDMLKPLSDTNDVAQQDTLVISTEDETTTFYYALNSFQIENGIVDFVDKSMDKTFRYHLSEITTSIDSITSESTWIDVIATMKLNNRGNLNAEIGLNPMNPMELDLFYVITDFQLSDLNIYSTHYAGLPILYGDMYYKSETSIRNGIMDSKNELIFEDVELGDQSTSLIDLPLGLALFILKDKNGDITLNVPVHGDLNEPGVSIKKIVWDSFSGFIGKIAAAPFKILGNMFGIDPNDIKDIEYEYGKADLTDQRKKQIDELLKLEGKKADLGIELVYFNDIGKEREYLAMDIVGQKFNNKKRNYKDDPKEFAKYVRKKAKNDTIDVGVACLQMVNPQKIDTLMKTITIQRLTSIETYLQTKSDSTNISFYVPEADAPKNVGSIPVFEIKYSMRKSVEADSETEEDDQVGDSTQVEGL